jgi:DNA-directed RNA polymerase specialized sigma24 family protein
LGIDDREAFRSFAVLAEPRLRRALIASLGPDRGLEATAEALAYAWENWTAVRSLANPVGYLYRVGRSRTRPPKRRYLFARAEAPEYWVEPGLSSALFSLPERQRVSVILVHAAGLTHQEAADLLGVSVSTVRTNIDRGLAKLRRKLGTASGE